MANQQHLDVLMNGVEAWNEWRESIGAEIPNISGANLHGMNLENANLSHTLLKDANLSATNLRNANLDWAVVIGANFSDAVLIGARLSLTVGIKAAKLTGAVLCDADLLRKDLEEAHLVEVNLSRANLNHAKLARSELMGANLQGASMVGADLFMANLTGADLRGANLVTANLINANLSGANLSGAVLKEANLSHSILRRANLTNAFLLSANLVQANLEQAILSGCSVYGISVWDANLNEAEQNNLIISREGGPQITVDNIEVAQFIYLLLNNQKIRHVIDTITSKAVLILGRFTAERKAVLDAIREELRRRDYLPILFDFEPSANRDIRETVSTLAHMSRFIIADITDARSIPQELEAIVPQLPSVPVQPLLLSTEQEYGMFEHFKRYPSMLEIYRYENQQVLLDSIQSRVIEPAEIKAREVTQDRY